MPRSSSKIENLDFDQADRSQDLMTQIYATLESQFGTGNRRRTFHRWMRGNFRSTQLRSRLLAAVPCPDDARATTADSSRQDPQTERDSNITMKRNNHDMP